MLMENDAGIVRETVESRDGTLLATMRLGEGPPLVVCHGSFAVADDWLPFARCLASTRTVHLYDRRGRGGSPCREEDFALDAEVADLAAVVARAGPGVAVLGHSFGGGCALGFAASHAFPGALILYEPRHAIRQSVSRGYAPEVARLVSDGDSEGAMLCVLEKVVGMAPDVVARFRDSPLWEKMRATVGAFAKEVRFLDGLQWKPGDLDGIAGPIDLLIGERSHHSPDEAAADEALTALLPRFGVRTIEGEGHFAYATAPATLAAIVDRLLADSRH